MPLRATGRATSSLCKHERTIAILPLVRRKTRQYGMTIYELTFCPNFNTPRNDLLVAGPQHAARGGADGLERDPRRPAIMAYSTAGKYPLRLRIEQASRGKRRGPEEPCDLFRRMAVALRGYRGPRVIRRLLRNEHQETLSHEAPPRFEAASAGGGRLERRLLRRGRGYRAGLEDLFEIRRAVGRAKRRTISCGFSKRSPQCSRIGGSCSSRFCASEAVRSPGSISSVRTGTIA